MNDGLHRKSDGSAHAGACFELCVRLHTQRPAAEPPLGHHLFEGDVDEVKRQVYAMVDALYDNDRNWLTKEEHEAWLTKIHGEGWREREVAYLKTLVS